MTERDIIKKAIELRVAQKEYFRTRSVDALNKARVLEIKFDAILKQYFENDGQTSLFP